MIARRIFSLFLRLSTLKVKEIFHVVAVVIIVFVSWNCQTYYTAYMWMSLHFNFSTPSQLLFSSLFFSKEGKFLHNFKFREIISKKIFKKMRIPFKYNHIIVCHISSWHTTHFSSRPSLPLLFNNILLDINHIYDVVIIIVALFHCVHVYIWKENL